MIALTTIEVTASDAEMLDELAKRYDFGNKASVIQHILANLDEDDLK